MLNTHTSDVGVDLQYKQSGRQVGLGIGNTRICTSLGTARVSCIAILC